MSKLPEGIYCRFWTSEAEFEDFSDIEWTKSSSFRRLTGIAELRHGQKIWFMNDKFHREDGPANILSNGRTDWYIRDKNISRDVIAWFREMNWNYSLGLDTDEKKTMFRLKFV